MRNKTTAIIILTISIFALQAKNVIAVEEISLGKDEALTLDVTVSSPNQTINTIEGQLVYPLDLLKITNISYAQSAVPLWIKQPETSQVQKLTFSGAMPGGVQQDRIHLFSVVFQGMKEGNGEIKVDGLKGLRHDGIGTLIDFPDQNINFKISSKGSVKDSNIVQAVDTNPPLPFKVQLYFDEAQDGGRWQALFYAQDKESGISHYEVWETKNPNDTKELWIKSSGQYELKDQKLTSYIFVRAYDNAGNVKLETLPPHPKHITTTAWAMLTFTALAILYLIGKRAASKKNQTEDEKVH